MTKEQGLYYLALGGANEIGMNMYLYGLGTRERRRWIMVDCGIGFPNGEFNPGVEIMTADPSFLEDGNEVLEAIFITHAHEDHVGAVGYLRERLGHVPIFATPFPAAIARRKLDDRGHDRSGVREVPVGGRVDVGNFAVTFFPMTHSVPETNALIIETPFGKVFHTADFKIDRTPTLGKAMDEEALRALGVGGMLAVACDSTNVFAPGWSGSESDILDNLREAISRSEGRVAATSFASNVARLKALAEAAEANDRAVVVAGRAMHRMIETAIETGVITSFPPTVPDDRIDTIPDRNLFFLVTGSQGEGRAATARIANGSHPSVELGEGDLMIFSSKTIPGNEEDVARVYNLFSERGVRVLDSDMLRIHVSGHARREELKRIYALLKPQISIPMHGEHRHLSEHVIAAREWGVPESVMAPNGRLVRLAPGTPAVENEVETGRLYLDGRIIIGAMDGIVRARRRVALSGHVTVAVVIDELGELIADPEIRLLGIPEENAGWQEAFEETMHGVTEHIMEHLEPSEKRSNKAIEELLSASLRRQANYVYGKKPQVTVIVVRLEEVEA